MPNKPQRSGGRMQNYFPLPARYRPSAAVGDEGEWGARLVGFFFIVFGALMIARPVLSSLQRGTALFFGVFGIPALATRVNDPWISILVGCVLLAAGIGIVLRRSWAHWAGMILAAVLFIPAVPYVTLAGLLIIYALWHGRPPQRKRS